MLRDEPGWITFSIDGQYAYPSTGDVIDTGILAQIKANLGITLKYEVMETNAYFDRVAADVPAFCRG